MLPADGRRAEGRGSSGRSRGWGAGLLAGALLLALWHGSPVLLWQLRLESQLRGQGDAARLRSAVERTVPGGGASWSGIATGELALRAPLASEERARCGACAVKCRLQLIEGGTLAIFDAPPPEDYREALDRFAPDARDVSLLRSVPSNWRTIDALTDRVRAISPPPRSFRFYAERSRGVVTAFSVAGTPRYVVYAYGEDELPARIVGLTGVSRDVLLAVLGELRVERDRHGRPASCVPPVPRRRAAPG